MATSYLNKCQILADLWTDHRDDDEFKDFVEYNDIGLPLAYAIANEIVDSSQMAESFINETFRLLLLGLDLEDSGFDSLTDILGDDDHDEDDEPEESTTASIGLGKFCSNCGNRFDLEGEKFCSACGTPR